MISNRVSALIFSRTLFFLASCLPTQAFGVGGEEPLPLHSVIETAGVVIGIIVTLFLLQRERAAALTAAPVATGFMGMGILDAFHASVSAGNEFIFLRSAGHLFGAVGFMLIWVPEKARRPVVFWTHWLPLGVAAVALSLGIETLRNPNAVPTMVQGGAFSPLANLINHGAGILFLAAALGFAIDFHRIKRRETLVFAGIGLLFGLAGLIFSRSVLWDDIWWTWHALRLSAYGVVFWLINAERRELVSSLRLSLEERDRVGLELRNLNIQLERRVAERTAELSTELAVRKAAETKLARSNRELEQFAGVAAHDLRSPIKLIRSWIEMLNLLVPAPRSKDLDQALTVIENNAKRADDLVGDVLEIARVNIAISHIDQVDLNQIVSEVLVTLHPEIESAQAKIYLSSLPVVRGNPTYLGSVFSNLICNALIYRDKARKVEVSVGFRELIDRYEFFVKDNGIGIGPQDAGQVFEMFKRLHSGNEYPGTGIGLAFCKKVVELSGGNIWVDSLLGRGSTFFFTYPKNWTG